MARYIDAHKFGTWLANEYFTLGRIKEVNDVFKPLSEFPSEDVAPVTHAHWKRHFKRQGVYEDLWLYCTNCNSRTLEEYAPYLLLYCPYCGAKMDEGGRD